MNGINMDVLANKPPSRQHHHHHHRMGEGEDPASCIIDPCKEGNSSNVPFHPQKLFSWVTESRVPIAEKKTQEVEGGSAAQKQPPSKAISSPNTNTVKNRRHHPYQRSIPGLFRVRAQHGQCNMEMEFDSRPLKRTSSQVTLQVGTITYTLTTQPSAPADPPAFSMKKEECAGSDSCIVEVKLPDANTVSFSTKTHDTVTSLRNQVIQEMHKRYPDMHIESTLVLKNPQGFPLNLSDRLETVLKHSSHVVCYI